MPLNVWSKRKSKSEVFDDRNLLEFVLIKKNILYICSPLEIADFFLLEKGVMTPV
jgi:hypothetical protein